IPQAERIAAIDLDGTLMVEQPRYAQVELALEILRDQARADRNLQDTQPWKAARENDYTYVRENTAEVLLKAIEGMSLREYREHALRFLRSKQHERFGVPFSATLYEPMIELIEALRSGGFAVYLISGSKTEFLRALREEVLSDFSSRDLIGTRVAIEFDPSGPVFTQSGYFQDPDSWLTGKAEKLRESIGRGPVFVAGNGMIDYELLTYADSSTRKGFCLVINHDDESREYAYTDEELLKIARERGWTIVSMEDDWRTVLVD
ncbi:MAG: HAD family hydrolase, partial [Verrucomicrobiota bacterium]